MRGASKKKGQGKILITSAKFQLPHSFILAYKPKCDPDTCPRNGQNFVTDASTAAEVSKGVAETSTLPYNSSSMPFSPDRKYVAPDVQRHGNEGLSTHSPFNETPVLLHETPSSSVIENGRFGRFRPLMLPELFCWDTQSTS
jgi:hypothetical protein